MTQHEKREKFKFETTFLSAGCYAFIAGVFLMVIFKSIALVLIGAVLLMILTLFSGVMHDGSRMIFNPFLFFRDLHGKQEALMNHLKLRFKLIPRHYEVEEVPDVT